MNSKQKGSGFEREICKIFSRWASSGKSEDLYWRSAMSGGRATLQYKKGIKNQTQVADISSISSQGEFLTDLCCIECKSYKDLHLGCFIYGTNQGVSYFWKELSQQALNCNKYPILVMKENRKPILIGINKTFFVQLIEYVGIDKLNHLKIRRSDFTDNLVVFHFLEFLDMIEPYFIKEILLNRRRRLKI